MLNLVLHQIQKSYGAHTVLKFEELTLGAGVHWLKGGNGTGKTTLFRIIAGLTPFKGKATLNGIELAKNPVAYRSKISYAEAEPQYPLFITGGEMLEFYREIRNATPEEVSHLASLFDLSDFLSHRIGAYSSGMLKKLSLICALLGDVELYILDEPLITIDHTSSEKLYQLIGEKVKLGKSFLLSSHHEIDRSQLVIQSVLEIRDKHVVRC